MPCIVPSNNPVINMEVLILPITYIQVPEFCRRGFRISARVINAPPEFVFYGLRFSFLTQREGVRCCTVVFVLTCRGVCFSYVGTVPFH